MAEPIRRLFSSRYTPRGVSYLLHGLGWSPKAPAHRAVERATNRPWPGDGRRSGHG
ncbi:winged helix-turn-helix domain-containing protein [Streptomyces sp. NPDC127106]|uniref:winged helix-turn-helix domain-containing protein n=1 Tax=Streptomyces sp. NPDC127106 TaxID=3345360 RepID=UPI003642A817